MSYFLGLDVALKPVSICVVETDGTVIARGEVSSDPDQMSPSHSDPKKCKNPVKPQPVKNAFYWCPIQPLFGRICKNQTGQPLADQKINLYYQTKKRGAFAPQFRYPSSIVYRPFCYCLRLEYRLGLAHRPRVRLRGQKPPSPVSLGSRT